MSISPLEPAPQNPPVSPRSSKLHVDLVNVAPAPALPRLERGDDRMPGFLEMLGGVLVLRIVAAADVPARPAQAQMHPGVSRREAFLAAVGVGRSCLYGFQMRAASGHRGAFPFIGKKTDGSPMLSPRGRPACTRGVPGTYSAAINRSEEHTSELQSQFHLVCRLLLEKKKQH